MTRKIVKRSIFLTASAEKSRKALVAELQDCESRLNEVSAQASSANAQKKKS